MLGKDQNKYSSKRLQSLAINPKQKPTLLLRSQSTSEFDLEQRSINSTDHDIKMFNHKKDALKSNYKKDWNDKDFDKISQISYANRTIKEYDSRGYDYQFNKNGTGMNRYRSGFLKKDHISPSSKLSTLMSNDINEVSYKNTLEGLEIQNSKLQYEKIHLSGRISKYLQKINIIESHNLQVQEELDEVKISYQSVMHQYRQLSLMYEDSLQKQRELNNKVQLLTDKNFKLQQMLYNQTESQHQGYNQQDDQIQKILIKTRNTIDQYVIELDSLRQLINEKEQSQIKLQIKIEELELELQIKSQNDKSQQDEYQIQKLTNIIQTQKEVEQALQDKIQRLSTTIICNKCASHLILHQSKLNIPTSTSLNI